MQCRHLNNKPIALNSKYTWLLYILISIDWTSLTHNLATLPKHGQNDMTWSKTQAINTQRSEITSIQF